MERNQQHTRVLAAVMFIDMVNYTAMMQEDESRAIAMRSRKRAVLQQGIRKFQGTIVQYYGDGALNVFSSARNAAACALYIQRKLRCLEIPVRVGLHLGEVVRDSEGIYGHAVNVAARLESLAPAGGILMSGKLYDELKNQAAISATSVGTFVFKNVEHPIAVYSLGEQLTSSGISRIRDRWLESETQKVKNQLIQPFLTNSAAGYNN